MGYKRFVKALVVFIVLFVLANFAAWELHTQRFFEGYDPMEMGDLARLGYMPEYGVAKEPASGILPGLVSYVDYHGQQVDMVVIGDSFSMGVGGGEHPFFQEYIILHSGREDFKVLSLVSPRESGVEIGWKLLNSGLLKKINPKYFLIESVERACIEVYGLSPADPGLTDTAENLDALFLKGGRLAGRERVGRAAEEEEKPFFRFMTFANLKHPLYKLLYSISGRPPGARVFKAELDRPMFSTPYPRTLLYLDADIDRMGLVSAGAVSMLNRNMNSLADAMAEQGVSLYFMPAPDKYSLYAPYIKNNDLPQNPFFALMRTQDRRYGYIDTGAILSEALREGAMDLYHQDDTHWSYRASERIFSSFRFEPLPASRGR